MTLGEVEEPWEQIVRYNRQSRNVDDSNIGVLRAQLASNCLVGSQA